ncbi:MAG: hypothetical protein O3B86_14230, partial [Planctomycetota bacterium]|nr:hypothetical protein [Planctomycetota bacterium]
QIRSGSSHNTQPRKLPRIVKPSEGNRSEVTYQQTQTAHPPASRNSQTAMDKRNHGLAYRLSKKLPSMSES